MGSGLLRAEGCAEHGKDCAEGWMLRSAGGRQMLSTSLFAAGEEYPGELYPELGWLRAGNENED